jgi:hypothetical protein
VSHEPSRAPIDYEVLASFLTALGYPLRLQLLDVLRTPHALGEIRVSPLRIEPGGNAERPAAKTTIAAHLEKLVATGVVREESDPSGGRGLLYVVNPQRLYAITEDLRRLSLHHAGAGHGDDETGTMQAPGRAPPARVRGPRLILVHGVYEGKHFPLTSRTMREGAWTIGRGSDQAIALDYDPFVSLQHASLAPAPGAGYALRDLGGKNGTTLNWSRLPREGRALLEAGDIIGVGRSLLQFMPD